MKMISGLQITPLIQHKDERGTFIEVFRQTWVEENKFIQWNVVHSNTNTLRGIHVHTNHDDYLTLLRGRMLLFLKDLRTNSPTENLSMTIEMTPTNQQAVLIPHGVAHGFWFTEPSTHLYAVSHYWDIHDELGCRYDDPDLGFELGNAIPRISERDQNLPSLAALSANHSFIYQP